MSASSNYLLQLKTPSSGTFQMLLKYHPETQELVAVELRDFSLQMNEKQRDWLWGIVPKVESALEQLKTKYKAAIRITPIQSDLTFETWWELYDYKVGNKKRARQHWEKLDDDTRAIVMQKTREYNFYMQHVTHAKVFAERFLTQERWQNDFKTPQ